MKFNFVLLVISVITTSGIAYNLKKVVKKDNANTVLIYKSLANNTGGNVVASSDDLLAISTAIQFKDEKTCEQSRFPTWTATTIELTKTSQLVNNYDHTVYDISTRKVEQFDAFQRTRTFTGQSYQENTKDDPPNFVSTLRLNNSVSFTALLNTFPGTTTKSNLSISAETIQCVGHYPYHESDELKATFLTLPLLLQNASMTIVVPRDVEGVQELEQRLDQVLATPSGDTTTVSILLPVFSVESEVNLRDVLDNRDKAEDVDADGSKFMQKTLVSVEKTPAGVADFSQLNSGEVSELTQFVAKRPFLFFVKVEDFIVFIGKVVVPKSEG